MNTVLRDALRVVACDDLQANVVDAGLVKQCDLDGGVATVRLVYGFEQECHWNPQDHPRQ